MNHKDDSDKSVAGEMDGSNPVNPYTGNGYAAVATGSPQPQEKYAHHYPQPSMVAGDEPQNVHYRPVEMPVDGHQGAPMELEGGNQHQLHSAKYGTSSLGSTRGKEAFS